MALGLHVVATVNCADNTKAKNLFIISEKLDHGREGGDREPATTAGHEEDPRALDHTIKSVELQILQFITVDHLIRYNSTDSSAFLDSCAWTFGLQLNEQRRFGFFADFLGIEDIHAYLAHLMEELDAAKAKSAKISNEIELLNSTYMEDSNEIESDLEWMKCSLVSISAQQDREREKKDE
ncbi:hypothetical protein SADUNF_Sadunf09G0049200 [Salix dunnii]|uniref:Uncharacterized protein n=1 Tax=Salix dunnii TaxID=1413687 RepID=A0A835JV89_9ROSI|nr:hypothetical protein SADUNF_Sadunf09G0049200 [Salix dunnii]